MYRIVLFISISILFIACKSRIEEKNETAANPTKTIATKEILIDLKPQVDSEKLTKDFKSYQLNVDQKISSSMNIVLCTFISTVSVEEMITIVKSKEYVENAQSNKKINGRNR